MGHTHNFQSSGWGCQILLWSWDSRSRLIGISQAGRYRRGVRLREPSLGGARMGIWEGDGHRSPLLCIGLPESALLAETRTYRLTFGHGWAMHLCPESSGNLGRTRAGIGMTLEKQRGPLPHRQTDSISGIPSDGSTSTFPAWVSVSTENRPQGSVFPERELPSRKGTCPGTKGEDGA